MIPLSRSSEYAIRALTYLAQRPEGGYRLAREMAHELGVPPAFLGKCLQPLVARGLLESQRGRRGGFRLAGDPGGITLYQIVDSHEHLGRARPCLLGQADCSDERACPLHEFWQRAAHEFLERLQAMTLADLVSFCTERPGSGYPVAFPNGRPSVRMSGSAEGSRAWPQLATDDRTHDGTSHAEDGGAGEPPSPSPLS